MGKSMTAEERETVISWCDADENGKVYVYTSQPPMIRKLLKHKMFEIKDKRVSKEYTNYPDPIAIEGYLPRKCVSIRSTVMKRELTNEQRQELSTRLKNMRSKKK